jgi:hypothetical protein
MTLVGATAALVVGGAATASAAPGQTVRLDCGAAGTFPVVINGNGEFTPGRRVDSTQVLIPTAFGETQFQAVLPDGGVVGPFSELGSSKGGGHTGGNNPHSVVTCTFSVRQTLAEDEVDPGGMVLPAGTVVTFSGSVTGFLTGRP